MQAPATAQAHLLGQVHTIYIVYAHIRVMNFDLEKGLTTEKLVLKKDDQQCDCPRSKGVNCLQI